MRAHIATALLIPCAAALQPLGVGPRPRAPTRPALAPTATPAALPVWLPLLALAELPAPALAAESGGSGYSQASFYGTFALYVLAFPGIYSLVKRSVKSKIVRKTYEIAGPAAEGGRPTREMAGDIVAFFQANNYKIKDASDVIVFEGVQVGATRRARAARIRVATCVASRPCPPRSHLTRRASQAPIAGRAAFLTACVAVALASLALVLGIFEQVRRLGRRISALSSRRIHLGAISA